MAAMSAVEVRDRLADRFRLLQGSTPGPERQLTLRHAVEWSYDLLTDDERDAAPHHVGVRRRLRPGEHLRGRRRRRRRRRAPAPRLAGPQVARRRRPHRRPRTRYRLFETIRQFAEDRLAETGALERTRDRHAAYFAREAAARWEHWNGPGWRDAVDWVEARARQPARRLPVERGPRRRWRSRPTSPRTPR